MQKCIMKRNGFPVWSCAADEELSIYGKGAKMSPDLLSQEERAILLKLARQALEAGVSGKALEPIELSKQPQQLKEIGASFVTLTRKGELRGCIGALEASQPLVEDVRQHAVAAALQDYRFPPVSPEELPDLSIEISRLTPPQRLDYEKSDDLLKLLRPQIDGVILKDGIRRATFLPQVWEKIQEPALFLNYLCQKMGLQSETWRRKKLEVWTYQVEEFHE
jgi:AmmeMemoRadiSam system protein A